jgi:hypothetical protein
MILPTILLTSGKWFNAPGLPEGSVAGSFFPPHLRQKK